MLIEAQAYFRMRLCEHLFVTSQASPSTRFRRALETRSVFLAELSAKEMGHVPLDDAVGLLLLYAEREPAKLERAALRWLQRLVVEREDVTLGELQLAAAALAQLPAHSEAAEILRRLAGK